MKFNSSTHSFKKTIQNQRGIALLETIPLLVVFVVLLSVGIGLFGAVHTAVLNSIAARTYAFETFRNRANLNFFREDASGLTKPLVYQNKGWRFHAVSYEVPQGDDKFFASTRPISFGRGAAAIQNSNDIHNSQIFGMEARNSKYGVSPLWVMVGYGMCLTAKCGN